MICAFSAVGGWIAPHDNLSILKVETKVLCRSGLLWDPPRPGDRVELPAQEGAERSRLSKISIGRRRLEQTEAKERPFFKSAESSLHWAPRLALSPRDRRVPVSPRPTARCPRSCGVHSHGNARELVFGCDEGNSVE